MIMLATGDAGALGWRQGWGRRRARCVISALLLLPLALAHAVEHPADQWEFGLEAGYLKKIRQNSPLDYRIAPAQLVWRSPAAFDIWKGESGARLLVRNRLAIVAERFIRGPEDYYFAFAGAPAIELW